MSKFGWDYPPGVTTLPGEEVTYCEVCFQHSDECQCPECTVCGVFGRPECYRTGRTGRPNKHKHGMVMTRLQLAARQDVYVAALYAKAKEEERRLAALNNLELVMVVVKDHPDWFTLQNPHHDDGYSECFTLDIDEQPDLPQLIWE